MRSLVGGVIGATLVPFLAFAGTASAAGNDSPQVSAARTASMRECTTRAQRYSEYTWGNMEFQQYRACMSEHRQAE